MANLKLLILSGLFAVATANPSWSIECGQGADFWCQDINTAIKCDSVDYCIDSEWSTQLDTYTNAVCEDCKTWIESARKLMAESDLYYGDVESLKFACSGIFKDDSGKCNGIVYDNVESIKKILQSDMDESIICSKILLCRRIDFDGSDEDFEESNEDSEESNKDLDESNESDETDMAGPKGKIGCGTCRDIVGKIEENLHKSKSRQAIEIALGVACSGFGWLSFPCKLFVHQYKNELVDLIQKGLTKDQICHNIFKCSTFDFEDDSENSPINDFLADESDEFSSDSESVEVDVPEYLTGFRCGICKKLVEEIEHKVHSKSKDEIRQAMSSACDHMKHGGKSICKMLVRTFGGILIDSIAQGLDSNQVCSKIVHC